jgi:hypothetical protein
MNSVEELFRNAFGGSGTIRASCECGREHFEPEGDFDEGELEDLLRKQSLDHDKYVCQDSVSLMNVAGKQFVFGCSCKGWEPYANFIWKHRYQIMEFLKARIEGNYEVALAAKEMIEKLEKTVQQTEKAVLPE